MSGPWIRSPQRRRPGKSQMEHYLPLPAARTELLALRRRICRERSRRAAVPGRGTA
jgi:hypothetical protein